ncbi:hypothetical protein Tco_0414405 [Tanacetum coccineum]
MSRNKRSVVRANTKVIVFDKKSRAAIAAIDKLTDVVVLTLGPRGSGPDDEGLGEEPHSTRSVFKNFEELYEQEVLLLKRQYVLLLCEKELLLPYLHFGIYKTSARRGFFFIQPPKRMNIQTEFTRSGLKEVANLADKMEKMEKSEYWELGAKEVSFDTTTPCNNTETYNISYMGNFKKYEIGKGSNLLSGGSSVYHLLQFICPDQIQIDDGAARTSNTKGGGTVKNVEVDRSTTTAIPNG